MLREKSDDFKRILVPDEYTDDDASNLAYGLSHEYSAYMDHLCNISSA